MDTSAYGAAVRKLYDAGMEMLVLGLRNGPDKLLRQPAAANPQTWSGADTGYTSKHGSPADWGEVERGLAAGRMIGGVPGSAGLQVIDLDNKGGRIDLSEMRDRAGRVRAAAAPVLAEHVTKSGNGARHFWVARRGEHGSDGDWGIGKHFGELKCSRGYVSLWNPGEALRGYTAAAQGADAPDVRGLLLRSSAPAAAFVEGDVLRAVSEAPEGERRERLRTAAFTAAKVAGRLERMEAPLRTAAVRTGLGAEEIDRAIREAYRSRNYADGLARAAPDRDGSDHDQQEAEDVAAWVEEHAAADVAAERVRKVVERKVGRGAAARVARQYLASREQTEDRETTTFDRMDVGADAVCVASHLFYRGAICLAHGAPKTGKTTAAANAVARITGGKPFAGKPTVQGRVVVVCEEARTWKRRLAAYGADEALVTRTSWEKLPAVVGDLKPVAVVVDTLQYVAARLGGLNLDRPEEADRVMRALEALAREHDCAVLVFHHEPHDQGEGRAAGGTVPRPRGSGALGATPDYTLRVSRPGSAVKIQYGFGREGIPVPDEPLLLDLRGEPVGPGSPGGGDGGGGDAGGPPAGSPEERFEGYVMAALQDGEPKSINRIAAASGKAGRQHRALHAAARRLAARGRLSATPDGHAGAIRYALNPAPAADPSASAPPIPPEDWKGPAPAAPPAALGPSDPSTLPANENGGGRVAEGSAEGSSPTPPISDPSNPSAPYSGRVAAEGSAEGSPGQGFDPSAAPPPEGSPAVPPAPAEAQQPTAAPEKTTPLPETPDVRWLALFARTAEDVAFEDALEAAFPAARQQPPPVVSPPLTLPVLPVLGSPVPPAKVRGAGDAVVLRRFRSAMRGEHGEVLQSLLEAHGPAALADGSAVRGCPPDLVEAARVVGGLLGMLPEHRPGAALLPPGLVEDHATDAVCRFCRCRYDTRTAPGGFSSNCGRCGREDRLMALAEGRAA